MSVRQTTDDAVYNAIERAARIGERCPSNVQLATLIGARSPSSAVRILTKLSRAGKIVVHSGQCTRVVDIPSLGIGTAGFLPEKHWREQRGQSLATHNRIPPEPRIRKARGRVPQQVRVQAAQLLVVSRDPCPWCGVRGDIGCRHGRAA